MKNVTKLTFYGVSVVHPNISMYVKISIVCYIHMAS